MIGSQYAETWSSSCSPRPSSSGGRSRGARRSFGNRFSRFEPGYHFNTEEARDLGDLVLLAASHDGRWEISGVEVHENGYLYKVGDGKVVRAELYSSRPTSSRRPACANRSRANSTPLDNPTSDPLRDHWPVTSGADEERLARALYLEVDYPGSIKAHERALAAYREEGDALGAARAARVLAWLHLNLYGDWALAGGWLARAESLLEQAGEDTLERGWAEIVHAILEPHGESRQRRLEAALQIGRRFADTELEVAALSRLGEDLVAAGRVEEGMLLFDQSLTAVCAGEVEDLEVVESVFCGMFVACERVHDVVRAEHWLRAADDLVQQRNLVAIGAFCRAHYGGILTAAGRWEEAETELGEAARMFERGYEGSRATALVRLADLRVRQGRLEEAAVLLEGLDQRPDATRPLAALYLARGETILARDLIERALSKPTVHASGAGPLLSLLVEVCLADSDVKNATTAADRLEKLTEAAESPYLEACAALANGKVSLASGSGDARARLREAQSAFSRARMPVELARTRLELAKAAAEEQPEVAVAEAKAALDALERRQARRDADAAAALLRSLGAPGRSASKGRVPLTKREFEVLALLGEGLSNPEIAERLVISTRTAEHHVRSILAKLDLRNRAQAAAYATRAAAERPGSQ